MPYDPNNEDHVAKRQKAVSLQRQQREADWQWLLNDPRGRRVAADLLREGGVMTPSYGATDRDTAFSEGRRSIGLTLYSRFTATAQEHVTAILADALGLNVRDGSQPDSDGNSDD